MGMRIWMKIVLAILLFVPSYTQVPYEPTDTPLVVASVMMNPFITSRTWLLPVFKFSLLGIAIAPFILTENTEKIIMGYYVLLLAIVGIFQNMAQTESFGFAWLIGNTFVEFVVLGYCLFDLFYHKSQIRPEHLNLRRWWVIPLMVLSYLMPYAVTNTGVVIPEFTASVLLNEAGVTYCMITPVILGILILFSKGIYRPTLSVISYVGLLFGLLNVVTWFVIQSASWWMGVLHLPLLIISFSGLLLAAKERC